MIQQTPLIQARLLNALRETQLEQGQAITALQGDVTSLREDVTALQGDVTGLKVDVTGLRLEFGAFRDEFRLGFAGIAHALNQLIGDSPA